MLKYFEISTVLVLAISISVSNAYEPNYKKENAFSYLSSRDHIAVMMRIDGGISSGVYVYLRSKYEGDDFNVDTAIREWAEIFEDVNTAHYLVLGNLKGELEPLISVDYDPTFEAQAETEILVFMDEPNRNGIYHFGTLQTFIIDDQIRQKIQDGVDEVVKYIAENVTLPSVN